VEADGLSSSGGNQNDGCSIGRSGISGGVAAAQSAAKDYLVNGQQPDVDKAIDVGLMTFGTDFGWDLGTQAVSGVPTHRLDPRNGIEPLPSPRNAMGLQFEFRSDPYHAINRQLIPVFGQIERELVYQTTRDYLIR
jgi:hypothetical protein